MGDRASEPVLVHLTAVPAHELLTRAWDANQAHRDVMSLFDPNLPGDRKERRAGAGVLFRLDQIPSEVRVLVQSSVPPVLRTPGMRSRVVNLGAGLAPGVGVRFRVAVNAVRRGGPLGERPVEPCDLPDWLLGKLEGALDGATFLAADRRVLRAGARALQVDTVDGAAVVADAALLVDLMRSGVGRSKSYGCGLLSVAALGA